jgi:predicted small lipoprotein YifL
VKSTFHRSPAWIAAVGALALALGLAGCGRKGALDPPPSATLAQPAPGQPTRPDAHVDAQGHPVAPPATQKRPFILDWLLD